MNAVFRGNGRVGSLDLAQSRDFIKQAGAPYQPHLASNLRRPGAEMVLDEEIGSARLRAVPKEDRDHFRRP